MMTQVSPCWQTAFDALGMNQPRVGNLLLAQAVPSEILLVMHAAQTHHISRRGLGTFMVALGCCRDSEQLPECRQAP